MMKFIDICAGIGGFHIGLEKAGMQCVAAVEKDKYARMTYAHNHMKEHTIPFFDDLFTVDANHLPDFDVLCAGFPCQPFSLAGKKGGFEDHRGNVFFKLMEWVDIKNPKIIFLENVAHLYKHNDGETFTAITQEITKRGYTFYHALLKVSQFGLPQNRPRIYMVGFLNDNKKDFAFPTEKIAGINMSDVFGGACSREIGFTLRVGGRGSGIHDRRNWDTYLVDGIERKIGIHEGKKMQGFPDDFHFPVSETQAMKQLGNAVSPQVIHYIGKAILKYYQENIV